MRGEKCGRVTAASGASSKRPGEGRAYRLERGLAAIFWCPAPPCPVQGDALPCPALSCP